MKNNNLMKKSMTKKALKNFYNSQRSQVGLGFRLGEQVFDASYNRGKDKREWKNQFYCSD